MNFYQWISGVVHLKKGIRQMKNKNGIAVFGMFFLAAIMVGTYGLIKCPEQLYILIGGGISVLITGALFCVSVVNYREQTHKEFLSVLKDSIERVEQAQIEMAKTQKENVEKLTGKISEIKSQIAEGDQVLGDRILDESEGIQNALEEQVSVLLEGFKEIEARTTKLLIKHDTENIGKLAAYNKKYVLYLSDALKNITVSARPTRKKKAEASVPAERAQESIPVMQTEETVVKAEEMPVMEEVPAAEAPVVEVSAMEAGEDPNKQLSPEEIAALFAGTGSEEKKEEPEEAPVAEVNEDPNKQLSPEEIAALFASAGSTEEAPEEPVVETPLVPELDGDPNKQLSPDEIAALFANLG